MTRFEKWSVWIASLLCGGTGAGYFWVKYFMEPSEPWAVINSPIQPWLLKAHILAAPLLLFALGTVAGNHFWKHYRAGVPTGRRTGITAMLSVAPMVLTGYLVQVLTGEGWIRAMAISHIAFGFLYLGGLVLHQKIFRAGKRRRRRRRSDLPVVSEPDREDSEARATGVLGSDPARVSPGSRSSRAARSPDRLANDSSPHRSRDPARVRSAQPGPP